MRIAVVLCAAESMCSLLCKPGEESGPGTEADWYHLDTVGLDPRSPSHPSVGDQAQCRLAAAAPHYLHPAELSLASWWPLEGASSFPAALQIASWLAPFCPLTAAEAALGLEGAGSLNLAPYSSIPTLQRTRHFKSRTAPWLAICPPPERPRWCRCPVPSSEHITTQPLIYSGGK